MFVAMFAVVTVLGFMATRWHRATSLASLEEWGLGGRRFGTVGSWFLSGGGLYTADTFVAVPALLFGVGAAGVIVATALTPLLRRLPRGRDETRPAGYAEAQAPPIPLGSGPATGAV